MENLEQHCVECKKDSSFGSGRFVNRIPCDPDKDGREHICGPCLDDIEAEMEEWRCDT